MDMENPQKCPYCANALRPAWKGSDLFLQCKNCQLWIRNQTYNTESLQNLYVKSWKDPEIEISETGGTNPRIASEIIDHLQSTLGMIDFTGLRILDFGAGRGDIAVELRARGAEIITMEPFGYEILEKLRFTNFRNLSDLPIDLLFDGIVSLDVIEHLPSPWEDIKALRQLLKPDGWIFLSTPNRTSLNARITGSKWREAGRQGHLYLFNPYFMNLLLQKNGFSNIRRVSWNIRYNEKLLALVKDWLLLKIRLDGELRYLAYR